MPTRALYGIAYGEKLKLSFALEGGTPIELGLTFTRFVQGSAHMDLSSLFDLLVPFGGDRCPREVEVLEFDLLLPPDQASWHWRGLLERELGHPRAWLRRMWGVTRSVSGRVPYVEGSALLQRASTYEWIYLYDLKTCTLEIHQGDRTAAGALVASLTRSIWTRTGTKPLGAGDRGRSATRAKGNSSEKVKRRLRRICFRSRAVRSRVESRFSAFDFGPVRQRERQRSPLV